MIRKKSVTISGGGMEKDNKVPRFIQGILTAYLIILEFAAVVYGGSHQGTFIY